MLVHIIADYGYGDLAFAEVVQRLKRDLPDAEPTLTPVPPFATLAAGFCVAPRQDTPEARAGNAGERLAFARLPTGVRVIGVNAGYTFAFVREAAAELRWVAVLATGSQFRLRDLFPQAAAAIALGRSEALADAIRPSDIPEVPGQCIAYVDGYLKTTIPRHASAMAPGTLVRVRIGHAEQDAVVSDGSFAVEPGQLALAPGSSGWPHPQGGETRWMELFLRGGNAWEAFAHPRVGARLELIARSGSA